MPPESWGEPIIVAGRFLSCIFTMTHSVYDDAMPRESRKNRKARCDRIFSVLKELYPAASCPLDRGSPFRLLVATILSAQCTDKRVNSITAYLFEKYRTPREFAALPQRTLEGLIRTAGLYRNKARNIRAAANTICDTYGGTVPDTMEELCRLPGVGRKTANVVLSYGYGKNGGFVVDTHVGRLSRRLKFSVADDPLKVERDLLEITDEDERGICSLLLIYHGRRICRARNPRCPACGISLYCPSAGRV